MHIKKVSIGIISAVVVLRCAALTIGPVRGVALIGHPLELTIPVHYEAQPGTEAICVDADVYYADNPQDQSHIEIQQQPTEFADSMRLRLRSRSPVDEPVVTVNLRVGCVQKLVRRFVLLAELPLPPQIPFTKDASDSARNPATAVAIDSTATPTAAVLATIPGERPEVTAPVIAAPKAPVAYAIPATRRPAGVWPTSPRTSIAKLNAPAAPLKESGPKHSQLKLEPVAFLIEPIKTHEPAAEAPPANVVNRDAERIQLLEDDLHNLREQTAKNEAELLVLRKRIEAAESERVSTELFYGLVLFAALCVGAIVVLWHRRRVSPSERSTPAKDQDDEDEPYEAQFLRKAPESQTAKITPGRVQASMPSSAMAHGQVDVNLTEID